MATELDENVIINNTERLIMAEKGKSNHVGLDGRSRDANGEIREKRGDTLVRTLRETYGPEFAKGVRGDARLDTLRERASGQSLSKIVKK